MYFSVFQYALIPSTACTKIAKIMNLIKTKLYLDTRGLEDWQEAPLKLAINFSHQTALLSLGFRFRPEFWDKKRCVLINHPERTIYNSIILKAKMKAELTLRTMIDEDEHLLLHSATYIKNKLAERLDPVREREKNLIYPQYLRYIEQCRKQRTKEIYQVTLNRLKQFDKDFENRLYTDVNAIYLTNFDKYLQKNSHSVNGRSIHFRNIRAVFNSAITNELTTYYPFRQFKIRSETTRKRALPIAILRKLMTEDADNFNEQELIDAFRLSFLLIGINIADLYNLKEVEYGRIEYDRAKTGRHYSIKVEPEAQVIIDKYKGRSRLLWLYRRFINAHRAGMSINREIKRITHKKDISLYWARHSWATIAAQLDIPKETIAHALGHGQNTVTDIYIDFDLRKVDAANRKVIDFVLYGKGEGVI